MKGANSMNQEKIGRFISKIRKEKNMTQQELADKLNVTDRAVGNWENGRRLPDYSIIQDLCNELGITINELLSGEKLQKDEYLENAEKNLISLRKQIDKRKRIVTSISYVIGFGALITFILNLIFNYNNWSNTLIWSCYSALITIFAILNFIIYVLTYK